MDLIYGVHDRPGLRKVFLFALQQQSGNPHSRMRPDSWNSYKSAAEQKAVRPSIKFILQGRNI